MNIIDYLVSVNKISIIAFIVTLAFLAWEWKKLNDEKKKAVKPIIPTFDPNEGPQPLETATPIAIPGPHIGIKAQYHKIIIIALIIMVFVFGIMSLVSLFGAQKKDASGQGQVVVREVQSNGIRIYDIDWIELKGTSAPVRPGDDIIIGVSTVKGLDLDKARIRINDTQWGPDTITAKYDVPHAVYYRMYKIGSGEAKLQIEAQLHSKTDGWLGE